MLSDPDSPLKQAPSRQSSSSISTLCDLAEFADYSFLDKLTSDPEATTNGVDHVSRQVFSGHYVPVDPTPLKDPVYVAHSEELFQELGFTAALAQSEAFKRMFSGDLSQLPSSMHRLGWATGYALSIFGTEYNQQCPFQTGNGYGDGRAISVLEVLINERRWEMQLKGGGRTPYCRGADGRAVLRSSVREFLAQEAMHALGVPTSRSLSLYVSKTERVRRPWYSGQSQSVDPDVLLEEPVAISTRVAPSFIRVGQLELFGRRARTSEHPQAMQELEQIVLHLIDREYAEVVDSDLELAGKVVLLAKAFRGRLVSLVANWLRVGYCQGNFNSDNCAAGGFTLDYGPFGFCEVFDPYYQPWTGGGKHFAFWNQPVAAQRNFEMFCKALRPLLASDDKALQLLDDVIEGFPAMMQQAWETMWATKLGLDQYDAALLQQLLMLMTQSSIDYTMFFRELCSIPSDIEPLRKSFYIAVDEVMERRWSEWLMRWNSRIDQQTETGTGRPQSVDKIARRMKRVNPKYCLREWLLAPAYQQAAMGDYSLLSELQQVMSQPYAEQSEALEDKYYRLRPEAFRELGGVSHMSCSS